MLQVSITYFGADFNEGFVENRIFRRKKELKKRCIDAIVISEIFREEREQ